MFYIIKIKTNDDEYSLESYNKEIIQREMDLYFDSFFGASREFKEKIPKVSIKPKISEPSLNNSFPIEPKTNNVIKNEINFEKIKQNTKPESIEGLTLTDYNPTPKKETPIKETYFKQPQNTEFGREIKNNASDNVVQNTLNEDKKTENENMISNSLKFETQTKVEPVADFSEIAKNNIQSEKPDLFNLKEEPKSNNDIVFDSVKNAEPSNGDVVNLADLLNEKPKDINLSSIYDSDEFNDVNTKDNTFKEDNSDLSEILNEPDASAQKIEADMSINESATSPEIENILNAVKNGVDKTNLDHKAENENLMDMFDPSKNIDIDPILLNSADGLSNDDQFSTYKSSDNAYKKNEAMLEDLFSFNGTDDTKTNIQQNIAVTNEQSDSILNINETSSDYESDANKHEPELKLDNTEQLDISENATTQEVQSVMPQSHEEHTGAVIDYSVYRAGFVINEFSDDFLICAYYIKNILHQDCFSMKFINSKLFPASGKIADMGVTDELIGKGYIKEYEVEFSKQYAITPDGERYFVAKFQS